MNISKNAITHQKGQQKGQRGKMAIWKMSLPRRAFKNRSEGGWRSRGVCVWGGVLRSFDSGSVRGDTEQ